MKTTATLIGGEEFAKVLKSAPDKVQSELKGALSKASYYAMGKAQSYAPIQFGALRNSIHVEGPTILPNNIISKVGTNLAYARAQEEGTGIYGLSNTPITPKRGKFLVWRANGQWFFAKSVKGTPGKRYFARAKQETIPILTNYISMALRNILMHLAK